MTSEPTLTYEPSFDSSEGCKQKVYRFLPLAEQDGGPVQGEPKYMWTFVGKTVKRATTSTLQNHYIWDNTAKDIDMLVEQRLKAFQNILGPAYCVLLLYNGFLLIKLLCHTLKFVYND